jgi:inner membrane protein
MDLLFGFIKILVLLALVSVIVLGAVLLAKKSGFLPGKDSKASSSGSQPNFSILKNPIMVRFCIISVLVVLMSVPLSMVSDMVKERSILYHGVLSDIARTWGGRQTLCGPALLIPYTEKHMTVVEKVDHQGQARKIKKTRYSSHTAIVLPESIKTHASLRGQSRQRGIYKSLVYTADLTITGNFYRPKIESLSENIYQIHWDKAWLAIGISDTKAINKVSPLGWSKEQIDFEPGTKLTGLIKNGFNAPLSVNPDETGYRFSLSVNVNGSDGFYFEPFGKTTRVNLTSDWPHPSFQGSVLPEKHDITEKGFTASWSIPHLARNYPQMWVIDDRDFDLHEFSAGVNLFEPVSLYSKVTRAIKYGTLFILLTYITFLIFEMGIQKRLHMVQYAIIGFALAIFYLSLLSMAEHLTFLPSYIISAIIIVTMISGYLFAMTRRIKWAGLVAGLLAGLYTILYILLSLEDYSLLAGTLLLLIVLAVMMYLTRDIGITMEETRNK